MRPHIPQLETVQITLNNPDSSPSCSGSMDSLDADQFAMDSMEESMGYNSDVKPNIKGIIAVCHRH